MVQTTQQWCWQKAQQAPVPLMLFHTDFLHSVRVSFLFLHLDHGQNEKQEGEIENLLLFN